MEIVRTFTFTVDKKDYTIKFDYNAISDMEELVGLPILTFLEQGGVNSIRVLIWGGLKWKIPGLTKQQAGYIVQKLMDNKQLKEVVDKTTKALQYALQSFNEDDESNEDEEEGE